MAQQFLWKPISEIEDLLNDDGQVSLSGESDTENNIIPIIEEQNLSHLMGVTIRQEPEDEETGYLRPKKTFTPKDDNENDCMPEQYKHVRKSERKVKDEVYTALANLSGEGLSLLESVKAVVEVANCCFGRSWKIPVEEDKTFDIDTMPHSKNIREMMKLLEAQSLDLLVDKM